MDRTSSASDQIRDVGSITDVPRISMREALSGDLTFFLTRNGDTTGRAFVERTGDRWRVRTLEVADGPDLAHDTETLVEAVESRLGPVEFRWRADGTGGPDGLDVNMLRAGDRIDGVWASLDREGPTDAIERGDQEAREALVDDIRSRLQAELGTGVGGDVHFHDREEWRSTLERRGLGENTLGFFDPSTGDVHLPKRGDGTSVTLTHELLHQETAHRELPIPAALDEGLTEMYARRLDASASQWLVVEGEGPVSFQLPEGVFHLDPPAGVPGGANVYEDGVRAIRQLEETVGHEALLDYYRGGGAELPRALVDSELGRGAWAAFVDRLR